MRPDLFLSEHPDLEVVELLLPDINGILRGKWIAPDKLKNLFSYKLKLPVSSLAFDVWGRDPSAWVFDSGDQDGLFAPEPRTLMRVPWLDRPTAQILTSLVNADHSPCLYDPRTLVRQLDEQFVAMGLAPVLAVEMEFSLLELSHANVPVHTQKTHSGATPTGGQCYGIDSMREMAAVLDEIDRVCDAQGLPVDTIIKESGTSQYEVNLYHQRDALRAADQAVLLQRVIRGVARKHNLRASFMAKPFAEDVGNGMHIHCSLENTDGHNVFDNQTPQGSAQLAHAISGTLSSLSDCMLLFAPNLNSYKRLLPGNHAPVTVSWGYDNRTVAIRVPNSEPRAIRIEHRVAGADANPYLAIAAFLAGMLDGMTNKRVPPAPIAGDAQACDLPSVPTHWRGAMEQFEQSEFVKKYFGESFRRIFSLSKRQEIALFDRTISTLEYDTYL